MTDNWSAVEEFGRDTVMCVTTLIPHDKLQGLAIATGLAITGHVVNTAYAVEQIVKLPWRLLGVIR